MLRIIFNESNKLVYWLTMAIGLLTKGKQLSEMKQLFEMHCIVVMLALILVFQYVVKANFQSIIPIFKVVVYPSYNDIHDIFLSEISSQRSRH